MHFAPRVVVARCRLRFRIRIGFIGTGWRDCCRRSYRARVPCRHIDYFSSLNARLFPLFRTWRRFLPLNAMRRELRKLVDHVAESR
jgi:hypothetical protein